MTIWLREELAKLHAQFSTVKIRMGFDEDVNAFIVEITPKEEYNNNNALDQKILTIYQDFICKNPKTGLVFISDDSILADFATLSEMY